MSSFFWPPTAPSTGAGTVTSVSVVTANGLAGTVATPSLTPAITLSTTLTTPVIAGNGTALIAATTTGSGSTVVLNTSPTLVTPTLGVASATSINKLLITAPATGSTLTVVDGKTLTASNTLTLTATDGSTLAIGTGGTLGTNAYTSTAYAPIASPTFTGTVTIPNGAILGTPASGVLTNCTGTAAGLTAGSVTTNANLTGPITASGNATNIASQTGTGTTFAMSASPTFTGGVGIVGAPASNIGLNVATTALSTVNQWNIFSSPTFASSATSNAAAIYAASNSAASAFTMTNMYGMYIDSPTKGAGSTITTNTGLYIAAQTAGSTNYAIQTTGTAKSSFGGNVGIGTTSPADQLHVYTAANLNSATSGTSPLIVENDGSGYGPLNSIVMRNGSNVVGDGSVLSYQMLNSSSAIKMYSNIQSTIISNTAGAESGTLKFQVANSGSYTTALTILNTGNVGIGNTNPAVSLDILGASSAIQVIDNTSGATGNASVFARANAATYVTSVAFGASATGGFISGIARAGLAAVYSGGSSTNMVVGTLDAVALTLMTNSLSQVSIASSGAVTMANLTGTGSRAVLASASGVLSAPVSDSRLKINVKNLSDVMNPLDTVRALRPVCFHWDLENPRVADFGDNQEIGLIAQETEKVTPQVIQTSKDGYLSLAYEKLVPLLIESIKLLEERIIELEKGRA